MLTQNLSSIMEKREQILAENTNRIERNVEIITSLLSEVKIMNVKCVGLIDDTCRQMPMFSYTADYQRTIICTLNKIVIELEILLDKSETCGVSNKTRSEESPEQYNGPNECGDDFQDNEALELKSRESDVSLEKLSDPDDPPEQSELQGKDILNTIKIYQMPKTAQVLEKNLFKPTGRRTMSKCNENVKLQKYACYEMREMPTPHINSMCVISHMESPTEFYIQLEEEDVVDINMISNIIAAAHVDTESEYNSKRDMYNELGKFCVAYVEKFSLWYRVEILDWFLDDVECEFVQIQLIDFGPSYCIPFYHLRPMVQEVRHYPRLAQLCHLYSICPPDQENCRRPDYVWSVDAIEIFLDILAIKERAVFKILFAKRCGTSVGVDLLKQNESSTVLEQLLKLGIGKVATSTDEGEENISFRLGNLNLPSMSESEKLKRFFDTQESQRETENKRPVCWYQERCRNKNCTFLHLFNPKDFSDERPVFLQAHSKIPLPNNGDIVYVQFTHVMSGCNFFVHLNPVPQNPAYRQFLHLDERLNFPETVVTYDMFTTPPALGEIVLARTLSGKWYRARVKNVTADNLQVFLVDYGDTVNVRFSEVRQIRSELLRVPFQAVECRLFHIDVNEAAAAECKRFVEFYYTGGIYRAKVVLNVGHLEVLILDQEDDLGKKLIDNHLAVLRRETCGEEEGNLID